MAKYRKKPVVIEAFQFDGYLKKYGVSLIPQWATNAYKDGTIFFEGENHAMYIKTLEGVHHASVGDYIIRGVNGELYPCKPDIFEETYERVEE